MLKSRQKSGSSKVLVILWLAYSSTPQPRLTSNTWQIWWFKHLYTATPKVNGSVEISRRLRSPPTLNSFLFCKSESLSTPWLCYMTWTQRSPYAWTWEFHYKFNLKKHKLLVCSSLIRGSEILRQALQILSASANLRPRLSYSTLALQLKMT